MRPGLFALLVCLLLLYTVQTLPKDTTAQSSLTTEAWTKLVQAFKSVQEANQLGAPQDQITQLTSELNTSLNYYGNATQLLLDGNSTGSDYYSRLSNETSTRITSKALSLQSETESHKTVGQVIAYLGAIVASVVSALLVMEYHRIPNFLRKRKFLKMKLEKESSRAP